MQLYVSISQKTITTFMILADKNRANYSLSSDGEAKLADMCQTFDTLYKNFQQTWSSQTWKIFWKFMKTASPRNVRNHEQLNHELQVIYDFAYSPTKFAMRMNENFPKKTETSSLVETANHRQGACKRLFHLLCKCLTRNSKPEKRNLTIELTEIE